MNIARWEPFREMVSLKDSMDRLFEDGLARYPRLWPRLGEWELPIDMYQTANEVVRAKRQKPKTKMSITELHSPIAKPQEIAERSAL